MKLDQIIPYESDRLNTFIGQTKIRKDLIDLIKVAKRSGDSLMDILLSAGPGMGKTRLARSIANELLSEIVYLQAGISMTEPDFCELMTSLDRNDVLLIDNMDQIKEPILTMLIDVLETDTFEVELTPSEKPLIDVAPFTFIGLTQNLSQIDRRLTALIEVYQFAPYDKFELCGIIQGRAKYQGVQLSANGAELIAEKGEHNPDFALLYLIKVINYLGSDWNDEVTLDHVKKILLPEEALQPSWNIVQAVEILRNMSGTQFEEFVAEMFRGVNFQVEHTGGAGDRGVDLIIYTPDGVVGVQCKQRQERVGPDVVRNLYGGLELVDADFGCIITTSTYSADALAAAKELEIDCLDISWLLNFSQEHHIEI